MSPEAIRSWRQAWGYTQAEAAAQIGVSVQAWRKWEQGERGIPEPIHRLLKLLNTVAEMENTDG